MTPKGTESTEARWGRIANERGRNLALAHAEIARLRAERLPDWESLLVAARDHRFSNEFVGLALRSRLYRLDSGGEA